MFLAPMYRVVVGGASLKYLFQSCLFRPIGWRQLRSLTEGHSPCDRIKSRPLISANNSLPQTSRNEQRLEISHRDTTSGFVL